MLTASAAGAMAAEIRRRSPSAEANPFRHPYYWAAFTYSGRVLVSEEAGLTGVSSTPEVTADYDQVLARLGQAADPALRIRAATALVTKAVALRELGRAEEAAAVYDQMVAARFGEAAKPELRQGVATVLRDKGVALGQLERWDEAARMFDQVVTRFGDAAEPELRTQVATALVTKGYLLGWLGRSEEAARVLDQVVARFGEASEPALREQVASALRIKAQIGRLPDPVLDFEATGRTHRINEGGAASVLGKASR